MLWSIFIFIIFAAIFFIVIMYKSSQSTCSPLGGKCFDGNGKFQYKGRGYRKESVDILLSRIDWLAKNSCNDALYTTAYIIAFIITLSVFVIIYAFTCHILSVWEVIIILFTAFIVCFSVLNLFSFHSTRYRAYYIRKNIDYISRHLNIPLKEAPNPSEKSKVPFRTKVHDVLTK
jgi:hypothetical protein